MLRKFVASCRAVSPIITASCIIVIAVSAFIVVYTWNMGIVQQWMTWTQSSASGHVRTISIENVEPRSAGADSITIHIQNKGGASEILDSIYVSDLSEEKQIAIQTGLGLGIDLNQQIAVVVALSESLSYGHKYDVKAVCESGASTEYIFYAE